MRRERKNWYIVYVGDDFWWSPKAGEWVYLGFDVVYEDVSMSLGRTVRTAKRARAIAESANRKTRQAAVVFRESYPKGLREFKGIFYVDARN